MRFVRNVYRILLATLVVGITWLPSPARGDGFNTGGDYIQGSTGTLQFFLDGTSTSAPDYFFINVGGHASLDGALVVQLRPGYVPEVGDTFPFLYAAQGVTGRFANETLPILSDGTFVTTYTANTVSLAVVPEPASAGMVGLAGVGLLVGRGRQFRYALATP